MPARQALLLQDLLHVHRQARHAVRDKYPDVNVTVFYIDVRTPGKNFDEFYRRAVEEYGVNYIKGRSAKSLSRTAKLDGAGSDLLNNEQTSTAPTW